LQYLQRSLLKHDNRIIYMRFITHFITIFIIVTTYTHIHIFFTQQIIIPCMKIYKSRVIQYLVQYTHIHICKFSQLENKSIWYLHPQQGNLEAHTSTLKVIPRFTSFQRSPWSIARSNLHPTSNTIILRHLSCQWTITSSLFHGTLPMCIWFYLEILMTKTNPSPILLSLLHSLLGNLVTTFYASTHLPSFATTPISGNPSISKASSHRKKQKTRYINALKLSYQS